MGKFAVKGLLVLWVGVGLLGLGGCEKKTAPKSGVITEVTALQAQEVLAQGPVTVLDVRSPEEFETGHVNGAVLTNFNGPDFQNQLAALDHNQPYLVYCQSGFRSRRAVELMEQMGFKRIYHLTRGASGGLPEVKGAQ